MLAARTDPDLRDHADITEPRGDMIQKDWIYSKFRRRRVYSHCRDGVAWRFSRTGRPLAWGEFHWNME